MLRSLDVDKRPWFIQESTGTLVPPLLWKIHSHDRHCFESSHMSFPYSIKLLHPSISPTQRAKAETSCKTKKKMPFFLKPDLLPFSTQFNSSPALTKRQKYTMWQMFQHWGDTVTQRPKVGGGGVVEQAKREIKRERQRWSEGGFMKTTLWFLWLIGLNPAKMQNWRHKSVLSFDCHLGPLFLNCHRNQGK